MGLGLTWRCMNGRRVRMCSGRRVGANEGGHWSLCALRTGTVRGVEPGVGWGDATGYGFQKDSFRSSHLGVITSKPKMMNS